MKTVPHQPGALGLKPEDPDDVIKPGDMKSTFLSTFAELHYALGGFFVGAVAGMLTGAGFAVAIMRYVMEYLK